VWHRHFGDDGLQGGHFADFFQARVDALLYLLGSRHYVASLLALPGAHAPPQVSAKASRISSFFTGVVALAQRPAERLMAQSVGVWFFRYSSAYCRWQCRLADSPDQTPPDAGFTAIDVAHDGVHPVFKARTLQPDLILMDVGLSHMNGIEATAAIRDAAPATKVVFVSAIGDPEVRLAALNTGGHDYVLKSLAGQQLINVIRHVFRDAEQE
jgi:CheY-like chemotaxis protein